MDTCEQPLPPANLEYEQCLLRVILKGAPCPDFLGAQHFADPIHGMIYSTMERFQQQRLNLSYVSLGAHFARTGELAEVGGPAYLAHFIHGTRPTLTAKEYARAVHDLWIERIFYDVRIAASRSPPVAAIQEALQ